jgi:hypothetical protein
MLRRRNFVPLAVQYFERGNHSALGGKLRVGELFLEHWWDRKLALKQILASEKA